MHSHGSYGFDGIASLSAEPNNTWDRRHLTLGIEEEFHLVDLRSRRLTPRAAELLNALKHCSGTFAAELQQTVIETNSDVTSSLTALRENLVALRAELVRAARPLGVGIASAGTMPLSVPLAITETPRFRRMLADYQLLVREQLICGMQVHVGIPDRDIATRLISRVEPWLPVLLALSASSPYSHDGQDTGYASSRNLIWTRWPTSGRAGEFASAAEYEALVRSLVASGTISDPGMIYFDVRPSAHVPTLELRVCDACQSVDTVVLIAGLFRAVVARELALLDEPPRTPVSPNLYRAAMWRAARSGLEGELVDLTGPRS
ncbi:MAG TPA: YbdK family carboxylate-amine ligase, partial [Polyangiales bacterium]|nr:YbdK family carboxylate-amine ligase [Polyangiales bacterium]